MVLFDPLETDPRVGDQDWTDHRLTKSCWGVHGVR